MIAHYLNLYQKPKQGNSFIKRYRVYNYKHKISALGWFDTASCDLVIPLDQAPLFLDRYLGNRVAIQVDNPCEPIWEGFINRITFSVGGSQHTISLDEMVNQATTIYSQNGSTSPTTSAAQNNTNSQAVYGIKAEKVDLGFQYSAGSGATTAAASTIIAQQAWPKASIVQGSGSGGLVTLEMLGFYHTLTWASLASASTTLPGLTALITNDVLPLVVNSGLFFDDTDLTALQTNTQTLNRYRVRGQTVWDVLQQYAEIGDATSKWVVGITPTDAITKKRRLYFRAFNSNIVYTAKRSDGLRIRNAYGKLVNPWDVRPDAGIRITDMLPGLVNGQGDDPRETWIATIDYDANSQSVIWTGDDNIRTEGVFQLNRVNKVHGKRFGAAMRVV